MKGTLYFSELNLLLKFLLFIPGTLKTAAVVVVIATDVIVVVAGVVIVVIVVTGVVVVAAFVIVVSATKRCRKHGYISASLQLMIRIVSNDCQHRHTYTNKNGQLCYKNSPVWIMYLQKCNLYGHLRL